MTAEAKIAQGKVTLLHWAPPRADRGVFQEQSPSVLFVIPGCHVRLSALLVAPGCRFDRTGKTRLI
jgi:hypothetical protein